MTGPEAGKGTEVCYREKMIVGCTAILFIVIAPFVWRKGPDGTGTAFLLAAIVALAAAVFAFVTGLSGMGKEWRVEAIFCGIVLAFSFVSLGIARAS